MSGTTDPTAGKRSKAERRMIRVMEKKGRKGFTVLRAAEVALQRYKRKAGDDQTSS